MRFRLMTSKRKRPVFLFALFLIAFLLPSCTYERKQTVRTTQVSQTTPTPTPTLTEQVVRGKSGDLRIGWPNRENLNPLLETTAAGRAVYDLVYRGLFRIDADERVRPDLASNLIVSDGGRQILIALQEGLTFHDQSPLTAEDVAAVLLYLMEPDCCSIWRYGLESVSEVRVLDERVLEMTLDQSDPWLPYALTFPIIPEERITSSDFEPIPGTGDFFIESYDPNNGLILKTAERASDEALSTLVVREYENQRKAMQAFERDELDLVFLDTQMLYYYKVRSHLRMDFFTGNELFFLSCNTNEDRPLSDSEALLAVKYILKDLKTKGDAFLGWAEPTSLGISSSSWLCQGESGAEPVYKEQAEPIERDRTLTFILPGWDPRRTQLAEAINDAFAQKGVSLTVNSLDQEQFQLALQEGQYDLAFLSALLPDKPEPGFFIREPAPSEFSELDQIRPEGEGLEGARQWRERWQQLLPAERMSKGESNVNPDWLHALTEAVNRSPFECLCLPYMGLVYGQRVSGQCQPNRYHPYENMKELWVWSG